MTAGALSGWFHTNYGTVLGLSFAMTGLGRHHAGMLLVVSSALGPDLSGWAAPFSRLTAYHYRLSGTLGSYSALRPPYFPEEVGSARLTGMPLNAEEA